MSSSSSSTSRSAPALRPAALLLALLSGLAVSGAAAQVIIRNPSIPSEEHIVYSQSEGGQVGSLSDDVHLVTEAGKTWLEVRQLSIKTDAYFRFEPDNLFLIHSELTTRENGVVIRRSTDVLEVKASFKPDELPITDPAALFFMLRGFPWGERDSARVVFLGSGGSPAFSFSLSVKGKETLSIQGRSLECWKAELGMDGVFGALVPRTRLWFLVAAPHYMVRYEGLSGAPGSPKRILELHDYRSGGGS